MEPTDDEKVCLVSYKIAAILLNGGPDTRPGFWKAYRRELELNRETDYNNYHVRLCQHHIAPTQPGAHAYFRKGTLVAEKPVSTVDSPLVLN